MIIPFPPYAPAQIPDLVGPFSCSPFPDLDDAASYVLVEWHIWLNGRHDLPVIHSPFPCNINTSAHIHALIHRIQHSYTPYLWIHTSRKHTTIHTAPQDMQAGDKVFVAFADGGVLALRMHAHHDAPITMAPMRLFLPNPAEHAAWMEAVAHRIAHKGRPASNPWHRLFARDPFLTTIKALCAQEPSLWHNPPMGSLTPRQRPLRDTGARIAPWLVPSYVRFPHTSVPIEKAADDVALLVQSIEGCPLTMLSFMGRNILPDATTTTPHVLFHSPAHPEPWPAPAPLARAFAAIMDRHCAPGFTPITHTPQGASSDPVHIHAYAARSLPFQQSGTTRHAQMQRLHFLRTELAIHAKECPSQSWWAPPPKADLDFFKKAQTSKRQPLWRVP